MSEVPKIVRERLRPSGPGGAHPDANLLAAFAERSLAPAERTGVLDHLALCGECREVLAVSVSPMENVPQAVAPQPAIPARESAAEKAVGRQMWVNWGRVAWAGLAAGVVVAVGVLVMHPEKKGVDQALQKSSVTPASPVVAKDKSSPAPAFGIATTAENRVAVSPPAVRPEREKRLAKTPAPLPAPLKDQALAQGTLTAFAAKKDEKVERDFLQAAGRAGSTSEAVEVSAGGGAAQVEPAQTADAMVSNEAAPVVRAKAARALDAPAPPEKGVAAEAKQEGAVKEEPAAAPGASAGMLPGPEAYKVEGRLISQFPAQWAIRGDEVQQSLDAGAHWKTVFQPHRPLLCVAAGNVDVWVGGKAGDLFHSANSGVTWNQVHPSVHDQTLTDDITHIDVSGPTQVTFFTSKNESWSTTDGGKTWEKK